MSVVKPARLWHFVVAAQADSHRLPGQRRVPREGGQRQTLASEPPGVSLGGHGHVSCCLAAGLPSPPLRARHALATPSASSPLPVCGECWLGLPLLLWVIHFIGVTEDLLCPSAAVLFPPQQQM